MARGHRVVIEPGFALDPCGEEIEVPERISRPLPAKGSSLFVLLLYSERFCRPVAAPGVEMPEPSRIEETFETVLSAAVDPAAIPIARLARAGAGWRVDRRFRPPRVISRR